MKGVHPVGTRRQDRDGVCAYCKFEGPLSKTHVPPKKAFNAGQSGTLVRQDMGGGEFVHKPGRKREGGIWGWWLCEDCNNKTSQWDEFYVGFVRSGFDLLQQASDRPAMNVIFEIEDGFMPGALIRSVLAGMLALDDTLVEDYPDLAKATFEGMAGEWPEDLRLLFAINGSGITVASAQRSGVAIIQGRVTTTSSPLLWTPPSQPKTMQVRGPETVIGSPPFLWLLTKTEDRDLAPDTMHVGEWIAEDPSVERAASLILPIVAVVGESAKEASMMYAYEDFIKVR